jgi:hypothetical protein
MQGESKLPAVSSELPKGASPVWSFPPGSIGHDETVKGYEVEATDGVAGTVSWASYKPGRSYMVVSQRHHLREVHYVIPAGVVRDVRHANAKVVLGISLEEAHRAPQHEDPAAPLDPAIVAALAHGMPGVPGGGILV